MPRDRHLELVRGNEKKRRSVAAPLLLALGGFTVAGASAAYIINHDPQRPEPVIVEGAPNTEPPHLTPIAVGDSVSYHDMSDLTAAAVGGAGFLVGVGGVAAAIARRRN